MADLNRTTSITQDEIKDVFDYHKWDEDQINLGAEVRKKLAEAFKIIIELVPPCPDRSVALRKIREARMDCNSAITHGGKY